MTARRLADLERAYALVDLGVVFALAAWIPQGFAPWWLPLLGGGAGWCATAAWRLAGRAFGRRIERPARGRTLRWSAEGLTTTAAGVATRVPWSAVRGAYVFRRERDGAQTIVLAIVRRDGGTVELEDGLRGWVDLASELPAHLAGCEPLETWFVDAVRQPLAPHVRQIFGDAREFSPATPSARATVATAPALALRTYLAHGTVAILVAAAVLLVLAALVRREAELASLGFAILAYAALSRLGVWSALQRTRARRA